MNNDRCSVVPSNPVKLLGNVVEVGLNQADAWKRIVDSAPRNLIQVPGDRLEFAECVGKLIMFPWDPSCRESDRVDFLDFSQPFEDVDKVLDGPPVFRIVSHSGAAVEACFHVLVRKDAGMSHHD